MQTYSTASLPADKKVTYWNHVVSEVFTQFETRPARAEAFDAEVRETGLGRFELANVISKPARVAHLKKHVGGAAERRFFLHMQLRGRLQVRQAGREIELGESDLVLCDSSLPYSLAYDEPCSTLVMIASERDIKQHIPHPEELLAARLPGNRGLARIASDMFPNLWRHAQQGLDPEIGAKLGDSFLAVFASAWLERFGIPVATSAISTFRHLQIKRHVEKHLRDPGLTARSVAATFGISCRYLHMICSGQGETLSCYIRRRRLEQCVRQLADPQWSKRTVTEIAFSWGFNNATHFARVFRERYGRSPREYRKEVLAEAESRRTK
ncbi:MAG TPA: helix-turn-helix domain-containing protein [Gammaproteobacteria bacterium]|nr:helix-turn-helix domain-containing protein [Gammaproteobacteria bacterium]